jgi:hypothetical protein
LEGLEREGLEMEGLERERLERDGYDFFLERGWGLIFCCAGSRSTHLVASGSNLDTDSM